MEPEKWPLRDIATAPSPASLLSIPFQRTHLGSPQPSEETTEILNPNVAEFVPEHLEEEDDGEEDGEVSSKG